MVETTGQKLTTVCLRELLSPGVRKVPYFWPIFAEVGISTDYAISHEEWECKI